jgi:hypothetical protein
VAGDLCRFDELGRFLFEQFCRELAHDDALVVWLRRGAGELERLQAAVAEARPNSADALVLTNVTVPAGSLAAGRVLDAEALTAVVRSRPQLLLRVPTLLGIGDRDALLPHDVCERSSADVDAALALARVFVPTRAYAAARAAAERFGFAVLTGPPEMGKTAIARMLGLAKLAGGSELHECTRPEQLWERFARDRPQVFVADDAFGSTEYRPETAERWAVELDRVLRALDERHWLLWTSRPAPLKAALRRIQREHGVERFPQPAEVQVDASDLDVSEKALILFRHAKAAALPEPAIAAVREHGWTVVSHPHFTPERIRRFVGGRLLADLAVTDEAVAAEIREPTAAMAESFRALAPEHRAVLVALLDVPPGPVPEHELTAAVRRHSRAGFAQHPAAVLDRLSDHFVRIGDAGAVTWVHPSWRDLVIEETAAAPAARQAFLRACTLEGLLLALSVAGGTGDRSLPLLRSDADWDLLAGRLAELVPQLEAPDATRLLLSLEEALTAQPEPELDALATELLQLLARRGLTVALLERWLELRLRVADPPPVPDLTAAWIELEPSAAAAVGEVDDWVTLVALLREHDRGALARFGFPARQAPGMRAFLERGEPPRELVRRLRLFVPELAPEPHAVREPPRLELYVPRQLSPELEALLAAPLRDRWADERLVFQVLRDL